MPFRRHFGFIFMEDSQQLKANSQKLYHTVAHELAHGAFGLEHPWQSKGTTQGDTYNLLDYTTKTPNNLLRKYQWYIIHNPKMSLFGGDEEDVSAAVGDCYTNVLESDSTYNLSAADSLQITDYIKSFENYTEDKIYIKISGKTDFSFLPRIIDGNCSESKGILTYIISDSISVKGILDVKITSTTLEKKSLNSLARDTVKINNTNILSYISDLLRNIKLKYQVDDEFFIKKGVSKVMNNGTYSYSDQDDFSIKIKGKKNVDYNLVKIDTVLSSPSNCFSLVDNNQKIRVNLPESLSVAKLYLVYDEIDTLNIVFARCITKFKKSNTNGSDTIYAYDKGKMNKKSSFGHNAIIETNKSTFVEIECGCFDNITFNHNGALADIKQVDTTDKDDSRVFELIASGAANNNAQLKVMKKGFTNEIAAINLHIFNRKAINGTVYYIYKPGTSSTPPTDIASVKNDIVNIETKVKALFKPYAVYPTLKFQSKQINFDKNNDGLINYYLETNKYNYGALDEINTIKNAMPGQAFKNVDAIMGMAALSYQVKRIDDGSKKLYFLSQFEKLSKTKVCRLYPNGKIYNQAGNFIHIKLKNSKAVYENNIKHSVTLKTELSKNYNKNDYILTQKKVAIVNRLYIDTTKNYTEIHLSEKLQLLPLENIYFYPDSAKIKKYNITVIDTINKPYKYKTSAIINQREIDTLNKNKSLYVLYGTKLPVRLSGSQFEFEDKNNDANKLFDTTSVLYLREKTATLPAIEKLDIKSISMSGEKEYSVGFTMADGSTGNSWPTTLQKDSLVLMYEFESKKYGELYQGTYSGGFTSYDPGEPTFVGSSSKFVLTYSHEISHKWLGLKDVGDNKNLMKFDSNWAGFVKKLPYINGEIEHVKTGKGTPLGKYDSQWINILNSIDVP